LNELHVHWVGVGHMSWSGVMLSVSVSECGCLCCC